MYTKHIKTIFNIDINEYRACVFEGLRFNELIGLVRDVSDIEPYEHSTCGLGDVTPCLTVSPLSGFRIEGIYSPTSIIPRCRMTVRKTISKLQQFKQALDGR